MYFVGKGPGNVLICQQIATKPLQFRQLPFSYRFFIDKNFKNNPTLLSLKKEPGAQGPAPLSCRLRLGCRPSPARTSSGPRGGLGPLLSFTVASLKAVSSRRASSSVCLSRARRVRTGLCRLLILAHPFATKYCRLAFQPGYSPSVSVGMQSVSTSTGMMCFAK